MSNKLDIFNLNNEKVSEFELDSAKIVDDPRESVYYDVIRTQLANLRQGNAAVRNRSKVRGGGKKPYKQKGTGNARMGTTRSPLHKGGGVIFGPIPRSYRMKINKKVKKLAISSALREKINENKLVVLDNLNFDVIKTKKAQEFLDKFNAGKSLIIDDENKNAELSFSNIPYVKFINSSAVNLFDLLKFDHLFMTKTVFEKICEGIL